MSLWAEEDSGINQDRATYKVTHVNHFCKCSNIYIHLNPSRMSTVQPLSTEHARYNLGFYLGWLIISYTQRVLIVVLVEFPKIGIVFKWLLDKPGIRKIECTL